MKSIFIEIPVKGDVYSEIQEKTGVKNYNFRLNMIYMEWMGEGFREMVNQTYLLLDLMVYG